MQHFMCIYIEIFTLYKLPHVEEKSEKLKSEAWIMPFIFNEERIYF